MTKQELAILIAREFGYSDSDTDNPEDDFLLNYLSWVDEVYIEILNEIDWNLDDIGLFSLSTTPSVSTIDVDSDILNIRRIVRIDINSEIPYRTFEWMMENNWDLNQEGEIYFWTYQNMITNPSVQRKIKFVYTPVQVYSLLVYADKASQESLGNSEIIPFPNNFIPSLKHGVRSLAHRHENEIDKANYYKAEFLSSLAKVAQKIRTAKSGIIKSMPNADMRNIDYISHGGFRIPRYIEV